MKYYSVVVEDHLSKETVVVGNMLTLAEARKLQKDIEFFNACYVFVYEHTWFKKKGRII